jgi:Viral coat protein P2 N-terminal domain
MAPAMSPSTGKGPFNFPPDDRRLMPGVSGNPGANQKPYFSITDQRRYHGLVLNYAATTLALTSMTFTIKLNGGIVQTFTGDQRDSWNQYDGMAAAAANTGFLYIPFRRSRMKDMRGAMMSSINVGVPYQAAPNAGGIEELRVEIQMDSNPSAITTFEMYAFCSAPNIEQSVWIPRIDSFQETPGVGANMPFKNRLTLQGDPTRREVYRLWANDTAAHITRTRIVEESDETYNELTTVGETVDIKAGETRVPQTNWRALYDGGIEGNPWRTIKSYNLNGLATYIDTASGVVNPLTCVTETYGTL